MVDARFAGETGFWEVSRVVAQRTICATLTFRLFLGPMVASPMLENKQAVILRSLTRTSSPVCAQSAGKLNVIAAMQALHCPGVGIAPSFRPRLNVAGRAFFSLLWLPCWYSFGPRLP